MMFLRHIHAMLAHSVLRVVCGEDDLEALIVTERSVALGNILLASNGDALRKQTTVFNACSHRCTCSTMTSMHLFQSEIVHLSLQRHLHLRLMRHDR